MSSVPPVGESALRAPLVHFFGQFGGPGEGDGLFGGPFGVHVAPGGRVLAVDDLGHSLHVFDLEGRFQMRIGRRGVGPGEFLYPDAVTTDPEGRLYVADTGANRIQILDPGGKPLGEFRRTGWLTSLANPRGIARCSDGRLVVTDWGNRCARVFSASGTLEVTIGASGPGRLERPLGIALDGRSRLYVSDHEVHRVKVFHLDGAYLWELGGEGTEPGRLRNPSGLAIDGAGRLIVADAGNARVQVLTPQGAPLRVIGKCGGSNDGGGEDRRGEAELERPTDVALGLGGRLYVVDAGQHRIKVFILE